MVNVVLAIVPFDSGNNLGSGKMPAPQGSLVWLSFQTSLSGHGWPAIARLLRQIPSQARQKLDLTNGLPEVAGGNECCPACFVIFDIRQEVSHEGRGWPWPCYSRLRWALPALFPFVDSLTA